MREHTTHFIDCGCFTEKYEARIAELEGELQMTKVCGSCAHWDPVRFDCKLEPTYDKQRPWSGDYYNLNHCHFTPSRWTAYAKRRASDGGR
jgi:hypothetical protein